MPCSWIAVSFSGSKPALEKSTEERRMENGSASTTWSAVTVFAPTPAERQRERAGALRRDRDELRAIVICPASVAASRSVIWSLPPMTWYFSFDLPKTRRWPWPR